MLQIDKDYSENIPKKRITKKSKKQFYDSEYFVYFAVWLSGGYFTQFSKKFNKESLTPSLLYWFRFFSKSHVFDDLNACKCYRQLIFYRKFVYSNMIVKRLEFIKMEIVL